MNWEWMLGLYILGIVLTALVLAISIHLGLRWQRELPKKPIYESLEALDQKLREKQTDYDELRETLFEAKDIIEQHDRKKAWLEANREYILDLERKAEELREVEDKLAGAVENRDKVLEEVRELETRQAVLETKLKGEQDIVDQLEDLRRTRSELRDEVAATRRELELAHRELSEVREALKTAQQELEDTRQRQQEAAQKHLVLQAEVAQMESERDHLQRQVENLTTERMQVAPPEAATVEERTAALWAPPVIRAGDLGEALSVDSPEEEILERAVRRIRDTGLFFPERSVYALHTGLKVAMESPLLVLAGISGTGKSALPRRYAEAMGMHFLNVPVQPGWDSPLDFVGFYNHLEGRFKPTELTRALVQMDLMGKEENRWPTSSVAREDLSDRMLIVLLDEMNLARIEYYFSDFLSKLEIRRDVNPADIRQRRAAEIALEIGEGGGESIQSLPLFVGDNVLFVGTINEDESTQTMSDKVVDRSNVMRFGRPRKLQRSDQAEATSSAKALHVQTWKAWRTNASALSAEESVQVEKWIQGCNDRLDEIGRPFAHRTAQIMREYVRQYPRWGIENAVRVAMADQVEMQVLPRLRGIDPQQEREGTAISGIQNLVTELGDELLGQAIERALERSESHLFLWQGVDRLQNQTPALLDA